MPGQQAKVRVEAITSTRSSSGQTLIWGNTHILSLQHLQSLEKVCLPCHCTARSAAQDQPNVTQTTTRSYG